MLYLGYDAALLPVTVQGVGSIHMCLDFIMELLAQPQPDKQLFAIRLASYLIEKYPLPKRCATFHSPEYSHYSNVLN